MASAAEVDAGLVMHYFGSKQELFRQVIEAAPVPEIGEAPGRAAEQILAGVAERLSKEPVESLTLLRSMLTNSEAADAASADIARYQAQIAAAIPAEDADLRAALVSAITFGITIRGTSSEPTVLPTPTRRRPGAGRRAVAALLAVADASPDGTAARGVPR